MILLIGARSIQSEDLVFSIDEVPPAVHFSEEAQTPLSLTILGATGDLARRKLFPSLFSLFVHEMLPPRFLIVGYGRQPLPLSQFHELAASFLNLSSPLLPAFLSHCHYLHGSYSETDFLLAAQHLSALETAALGSPAHRLFYLALPPKAFAAAASFLHRHARATSASGLPLWSRLIVEKPFGVDLASAQALLGEMAATWAEHEVFRIDHYLGKSMVQNLFSLRAHNQATMAPLLDAQHVAQVVISFEERLGNEGRTYFDEVGIIRDVVQNHLLQMLALLLMDPAADRHTAEGIRDAKVQALAALSLDCDDDFHREGTPCCVVGQYDTYRAEDPALQASVTATFAALRFRSRAPRWQGVPLFITAGKGMHHQRVVVEVTFKDQRHLTIAIQPLPSLSLTVVGHDPSSLQHLATLFPQDPLDAYAVLLKAAIAGDRSLFVRADEVEASWALLTPLLHHLEHQQDAATPIPLQFYPMGSQSCQIIQQSNIPHFHSLFCV